MTEAKHNKLQHIAAYGFDALGFSMDPEIIEIENKCRISFVRYREEKRLDKYNGVIVPQGIFESFKRKTWGIDFNCDRSLLLDRYRQIVNVIKDGGWVCFLVGKITDEYPVRYSSKRVDDTDLCKILLNELGSRRSSINGQELPSATDDVFSVYERNYATAVTRLYISPNHNVYDYNILFETNGLVFGVEYFNKIFFLPFHTTASDFRYLKVIAKTTSEAVIDYRNKVIFQIPRWLNDFRFSKEHQLLESLETLKKQVSATEEKIIKYENIKMILITQGEVLRKKIIRILDDFFDFKLDTKDVGREDLKIIDDTNKAIALIEVKGTKRGVKLDHVNQLSTARERSDFSVDIPGILIINCHLDIPSVDKKTAMSVDNDQIKIAIAQNILIVRTVDLIHFMNELEDVDIEKRREMFLEIITSGGGWLKSTPEGHGIVTV